MQAGLSELPSLEELRVLTGLGSLDASFVLDTLKEVLPSDTISKQAFVRGFQLIRPRESFSSDEEFDIYSHTMERLFHVFDTDKNGVVEYDELASGLSVLCGGTCDDKVKSVFSLFDTNGDGLISKSEMVKYLTSVFRITFETSPSETKALASAVHPETLAEATAARCFSDADLDDDGSLTFDEFRMWYLTGGDDDHVSKLGLHVCLAVCNLI